MDVDIGGLMTGDVVQWLQYVGCGVGGVFVVVLIWWVVSAWRESVDEQEDREIHDPKEREEREAEIIAVTRAHQLERELLVAKNEITILKERLQAEDELALAASSARVMSLQSTVDRCFADIERLQVALIKSRQSEVALGDEIAALRQRFTDELGQPGYAVLPRPDDRPAVVRQLYAEGWPMRRIATALWGYPGGAAFYHVQRAINEGATEGATNALQ